MPGPTANIGPAQTGGIALGLSLSGAIFVNTAVKGLMSALPGVPREELQLAVSGTSGSYFQSLAPEQQEAALEVIVEALSKTFILVYVGAAVTLVCSLLFTVCYLPSLRPVMQPFTNFHIQKRKLYGGAKGAIVG